MRGGFALYFLVFITIVVALSAVVGLRLPDADDARALDVISGDFDCNGDVETADVTSGLSEMAGVGGGCFDLAGDIDCSGEADGRDIVRLLRHVAGIPMTQPAGCGSIGQSRTLPPTSHQLIDEALAASEISLGESLLYHLYADLGDDRLPAGLKGANSGPIESSIFDHIAASWDTLPPAEKDSLRPYLLVPTDPDSWIEQEDVGAAGLIQPAAIEWATVSSDRMKVWWQTRRPEDEAKANAILGAMESKIWPDLVTYMGEDHAPLSDAGYPGSGGDGRFDIYLVHIPPDPPENPGDPPDPPVLGYVSPHLDAQGKYKCEQTPAYMNMNSRLPLTPGFLSTVAHEFMHAIQFTYDVGACPDYRWMKEATATWAENFVYPRVNEEHGYGSVYLDQLQTPLEAYAYKDLRQYGAYTFWFFLENQYGMHEAVVDTWQNSNMPDSLDAIETVIAGMGGFADVWPEFAMYNWNRQPYDEYSQWDKVYGSAQWKDEDLDASSGPKTYIIPTDLQHLTQDHYHFSVLESVRSLTFTNPFVGSGQTTASVQALILRNGQWTWPALDWTDEETVHLCLDKPEEDVDELVIVVSNSEAGDRNQKFDVGPIELLASPIGCEGWSGTVYGEYNWFDVKYTVTVPHVLFQHVEGEDIDNERYISFSLVAGGPFTWEVEGDWPWGCHGEGTRTFGPPGAGTEGEVVGGIIIDKQENTYQVAINGHRWEEYITLDCGDHTEQFQWPVLSILTDCPLFEDPLEIEQDGTRHARGECMEDEGDTYVGQWEWSLTEVE